MKNPQKDAIAKGLAALTDAETGLGAINGITGVIMGDEVDGQGSPSVKAFYDSLYATVSITRNGESSTFNGLPQMLAGLHDEFEKLFDKIPTEIPDVQDNGVGDAPPDSPPAGQEGGGRNNPEAVSG